MAQNDRVYEDLKIFIEGSDGKKRPLSIGYSYMDGDKRRFQITSFPPPGARTEWSGLIESRDQPRQQSSGGNGGGARAGGPGYGTTGFGSSAKHSGSPDPDDGIPFISQADTIADRLR